jgi:hypothetical protein
MQVNRAEGVHHAYHLSLAADLDPSQTVTSAPKVPAAPPLSAPCLTWFLLPYCVPLQLRGYRRVFAHTADIFFVRGIARPDTVSCQPCVCISSLSCKPHAGHCNQPGHSCCSFINVQLPHRAGQDLQPILCASRRLRAGQHVNMQPPYAAALVPMTRCCVCCCAGVPCLSCKGDIHLNM